MTRPASPFREMFVLETKLFVREPFAVFFTLLFPVLLLTVFGLTYGPETASYGLHVRDYLVPSTIATVTAYLGLMGIPIALAEYREMGVLRRYRVAPMRLGTFLLVNYFVEFVFLLASCVLILIVGIVGFSAESPRHVLLLFGVVVASSIVLFASGFAIAALAPSSRSAQAIGSGIFFPLLFLSGAAIPTEQMPPWLQTVSSYLPITKVVDALTSAWIGHPYGTNAWLAFLYMFAVFAAVLLLIKRVYRW